MKNILTNKTTIYYKVYEYTTPGTYNITIPNNVISVEVMLVGGGSGGTYAYTDTYYGIYQTGANGGQGSLITGTCTISQGTYEIIVGAGSAGVYDDKRYWIHGAGCQAHAYSSAGGSTSAFGNIAYGGGGSESHAWYAGTSVVTGAGGTCEIVTTGLIGTNGIAGNTSPIYSSYGAGGTSGGGNGGNGYAKITLIFDTMPESYDYTKIISTIKTPVISDKYYAINN